MTASDIQLVAYEALVEAGATPARQHDPEQMKLSMGGTQAELLSDETRLG